jgi:hypothetical protein
MFQRVHDLFAANRNGFESTVIDISLLRLALGISLGSATMAAAQTIRVSTENVVLDLPGRPLGEPHLAIDPTRPGHLLGAAIVHDATANLGDSTRSKIRCATFASVDGGSTWRHHLFDIDACFDPWVAITPDGHATFIALGTDPKMPRQRDALLVYHSADGGQTWDAEPVSLGRGHDHAMTVVDRSDSKRSGWLYVVSSLDARGDDGILRFGISVSRSRNGGRSFDQPVFIRPNNLMVKAETPVVLSDGTLMLSYVEPALGDGRTLLLRRRAWVMESQDGVAFSRPMFVNEACGAPTGGFSLSALAADASNGAFRDRLYFACNQSTPSEIVVGRSASRGESWNAAKSVHGMVADTAAKRKLMAMAVDTRGVLGVVWTESGRNPAGGCAADVYFGASLDGGETFLKPERIASAPSCVDRAVNGPAWSGDYFGLAVDDQGRFRLLWSGIRDRLLQLHLSTIGVTPR